MLTVLIEIDLDSTDDRKTSVFKNVVRRPAHISVYHHQNYKIG